MAQDSIRNPELVLALNVLKAENTPDARMALGKALTNARLLAPAKIEQILTEQNREPDGSVAMQPQTRVQYMMFTRSDGSKVFPAYTDWDELHKWQEGPCQTVILTVTDYAKLLAREGAGLVLNSHGQNIFVPKELLRLQPRPQQIFDPQKPARIHVLKEYPKPLAEALQNAMANLPAVKEGWLRMLSQEEKRTWLIVFSVEEGTQPKPLLDALAKAVTPHAGGLPLTMTTNTSPMGKQATAQGLPLYIRG